MIQDINNEYKLNLYYDGSINRNLLPIVPELNIEQFHKLKQLSNKKIIFYYNFMPESGQGCPIKNQLEHNEIIIMLSSTHIVIVPHMDNDLCNYIKESKITTIIFADELLNTLVDTTCKNLYYYAQIANESDIAIYHDSGRSFMYLNKIFIDNMNNNLKLHITPGDNYFNALNNNVLVPKNYVKCIRALNKNEIIQQLKINI
jgi:hypothetical protein